jgi:hypothetical protein
VRSDTRSQSFLMLLDESTLIGRVSSCYWSKTRRRSRSR